MKKNKEIVKYNIKLIKSILHDSSTPYFEVFKLFNGSPTNHQSKYLYEFFLKFLTQISSYDLLRVNNRITFFESTQFLSEKTNLSKDSTSRYINYLCAIGFLTKANITELRNTEVTKSYIKFFEAIENIKCSGNYDRYINAFHIKKYTENDLKNIDNNIRKLRNKGIAQSNISKANLEIHGFSDIAKKVYISSEQDSLEWYYKSWNKIHKFINESIKNKGFTTKQEIKENVIINKKNNDNAISKILKYYNLKLLYNYKLPTKEEKLKYKLNDKKYIITAK